MAKRELEEVRERRANPRLRSLNLTSYTPKKSGEQDYIISVGRTLDVSRGGVKVETHRKLDAGTELDLDIAVENKIIAAKGKVLHSVELRNGLFGTGIRFTTIREEDLDLLK